MNAPWRDEGASAEGLSAHQTAPSRHPDGFRPMVTAEDVAGQAVIPLLRDVERRKPRHPAYHPPVHHAEPKGLDPTAVSIVRVIAFVLALLAVAGWLFFGHPI